ncbi:hypothetical protein JZ751_012932, partial [Albula glossodonta]
HLKRSNREIALPIEACVMMLLETGMKEEGLFRIAAGASKLKKLKAALDCSTSQLEEFYSDPHAVAGALKSYLRELPEPLMSFQLYDEWIQASSLPDPDKRLQALWVTCDQLPKSNKANFRYLVKFLAKLAQDSEVNKMTPSNIAIESSGVGGCYLSPCDLDFNVSGMFSSPTAGNHTSYHGDYDSGTLERRRPGSQVVSEGDSRKESTPHEASSTPPPQRNGGAGSHTTTPTPAQLGMSTPPAGSRGPSPHMVRRGTKKPAPAPPKPTNPPPVQPSSTQTPSPPSGATTPVAPSPKPGQSGAPPPSVPRRHSGHMTPLQAPNHPPPQPPPQIAPPPLLKPPLMASGVSSGAESGADHSPPSTPTPPDTPPPPSGTPENPYPLPFSPYHSGSLPRPRPVPRPRHRPSVPPPPQPPNPAPTGDAANGIFASAHKIFTESSAAFKGMSRAFVPVIAVETPSPAPDPSLLPPQDSELESESTAL